MSNSLFEDENQKMNHSNNIYNDSQSNSISLDIPSNISTISDFNFTNYSFICKSCNEVPVIKFFTNGKMRFICKCNESPRDLCINDIYNLLYQSEKKEKNNIFNCKIHKNEKYTFYCKKHNKNLCYKCVNKCLDHRNEIDFFAFDENTFNKSLYLGNKINQFETLANIEKDFDNYSEMEDDIIKPKNNNKLYISNNTDNDISINIGNEKSINKEKENKIMENKGKNDILDTIKSFMELDDYNYKNLVEIIIYNYENHQHHNLIETISNLEKYITFINDEYNEIKLNYEFNEENIKDDSIELFGEDFFSNNKENCFLIINEKIMDLNHTIKLNDIFDIIPNNYPIKLDVKLIERKRKVMTNWTSMFNNISTITSKSNFVNYDSSNIISFKKMFYNCELIEYIPDISKLNTQNLADISFMFFNCSSLKALPDISKWNIGNVVFAIRMFENCSSLTSLPDLSKWDINKIKHMNYMFKNCSSIPNLKELLNWNISAQTITIGMFQGVVEVSERENNIIEEENNRISTNFKTIIRKICYCFNNVHLKDVKSFALYSYISLFSICIISIPFISLYNSFNLDDLKEYIHKPIKYINSTNYTNIKYIAKYHNITNLTKIKEDEENYINNLLNFTTINKNITFEFDQRMNKTYNILIVLIFIFNKINVFYVYLSFEKTKFNTFYLILILIFLAMEIISIIIQILDINIIPKLYRAFPSFNTRVINTYKIKNIQDVIITKINFLDFISLILFILSSENFCFIFFGIKILYEILEIRQSIINKKNF